MLNRIKTKLHLHTRGRHSSNKSTPTTHTLTKKELGEILTKLETIAEKGENAELSMQELFTLFDHCTRIHTYIKYLKDGDDVVLELEESGHQALAGQVFNQADKNDKVKFLAQLIFKPMALLMFKYNAEWGQVSDVIADLKAKEQDVGAVIAKKNDARESVARARKIGFFAEQAAEARCQATEKELINEEQDQIRWSALI